MTPQLAYLWLEAKRQWRNREALVFRLGLPTAVYLILQATGQGSDDTISTAPGMDPLPAATARMVALVALAALISGLAAGPALGEERASDWLRQLRVTPLRQSVAVTAKMAVAMSFALPAIALVAVAAGLTEDIGLGWPAWLALVGSAWIATTPITAVGTLIGLGFRAETAQAATTMAFLVLWLLGGIFTEPANMPDTLATVAKALPSYGVVQVAWSAASGDTVPASALAVLAAWTAGAGALATLAWRRVVAR
ncbi:MAG: ABC transporter permease [Acidimicrobiales bacterium]